LFVSLSKIPGRGRRIRRHAHCFRQCPRKSNPNFPPTSRTGPVCVRGATVVGGGGVRAHSLPRSASTRPHPPRVALLRSSGVECSSRVGSYGAVHIRSWSGEISVNQGAERGFGSAASAGRSAPLVRSFSFPDCEPLNRSFVGLECPAGGRRQALRVRRPVLASH